MEINDARPTSVAHLVGQRQVLEQVMIALDAAHQDGKRFPHASLLGPKGLGKTTVGQVIAAEMAVDYFYYFAQALASKADLNELLLRATDKCIIHIDEAHELKSPVQTALYRALDRQQVEVYLDGAVSAIVVDNFSLLLSTTDEYRLQGPLRDRMKLRLRFAFYDEHDLMEVLQRRVRGLQWDVDPGLFAPIARRAQGTPRQALRLLEAAHRVARAFGTHAVTLDHLQPRL